MFCLINYWFLFSDIPRGQYFIGLMHDGNVYKTVYESSKTYAFPTNIREIGRDGIVCGTLIIDDLSPRIAFEDCDRKLPFICGFYCPESAAEVQHYTLSFSKAILSCKQNTKRH